MQYLWSKNIRIYVQYFLPPVLLFLYALIPNVVGLLCIELLFLSVIFYYVCTAVLHTLVAGFPPRSQGPEGPANGHHSTVFYWFPCV